MNSLFIEYDLYQTFSPIPSSSYQLLLSSVPPPVSAISLGYVLDRDYLQSQLELEYPFDNTSYVILNKDYDVTRIYLYAMSYYIDLFEVYTNLNRTLLALNAQPTSIVIRLSGFGYLDLSSVTEKVSGHRLNTIVSYYFKGETYA